MSLMSLGQACPVTLNQTTDQQAALPAAKFSGPGTASSRGVVSGVTKPILLHTVNPAYTKEARRKKITGTCVLSVTVGVDGQAHDITILRSIAQSQPQQLQVIAAGLDANAVKAVQQYRFQPSTYEGKPVAVAINIEVSFRTF